MFTFLKRLFRRKPAVVMTTAMPFGAAPGAMSGAAPMPMPRVETASLQLAAIIARMPDELKKFVVKAPPEDALVALPLPTILKYLPTGTVRMSLASVVRQAPAGTFAPINLQEKHAVEVPLAEIFKRVSPAILRMRNDQRYTDLAEDGFDIFGDEENPRALAPRVSERPEGTARGSVMTPGLSSGMRVVRLASSIGPAAPPAALPRNPTPIPVAPISRTPTPVPASRTPAAPEPPAAPEFPPTPPLVLPLRDLSGEWPEPIKTESTLLNGATVSLPAAEVNAGLTKGKVAFQWRQIRSWLSPSPSTPTLADESTELSLPLRVVAPAFFRHTQKGETAKKVKKKLAIDASIPELFNGSQMAAPAPEPVSEPIPESVEESKLKLKPSGAEELRLQPQSSAAEVRVESEAAPLETSKEENVAAEPIPEIAEPPRIVEPAVEIVVEAGAGAASPPAVEVEEIQVAEPPAAETETEADAVEAAPVPEPEPQSSVEAPEAGEPIKTATLGELFGEPEKAAWSPNEIVDNLIHHPDIDGAIVALHEGLVIAHHLPESMKGEVFAAFLPQIFARLNQYSGEMKLGTITDLELNAAGRRCHIFRLGQIYFGALAKPGRTLPAETLSLCAKALAQN